MQTYTIKHSNIAALIHVLVNGKELDYVFMGEPERPLGNEILTNSVKGTPLTEKIAPFNSLPMEVRAKINKQFGNVFSLPLKERGKWVKAQTPFKVTA